MGGSVLTGIQFPTYSAPYAPQTIPTDDQTYANSLYQYYTSEQVFLELPFTGHYYLVNKKVSLHAGLSYRTYLTKAKATFKDTSNPSSLGMITMIHFAATNSLTIGGEYLLGLEKLHRINVGVSSKEFFEKGNYFQLAIYYRPVIKRKIIF